MLKTLGVAGLVGALLLAAGIATLAFVDPLIAGGVAAVIAGHGLVMYGIITNLIAKLGMGMGDMF